MSIISYFPSWPEFLKKESDFEKNLAAKVEEFKDDHPMLDRAIEGLFSSLPPPFDSIATRIYEGSSGSEEDKFKAVLGYFQELKNLGEEHYAQIQGRLNEVLAHVDDLKQITAKESTVQKIQELLISGGKATDEKLIQLKDELQKMGLKIDRIDERTEESIKMQQETLALLRKFVVRLPEQSKLFASQINPASYRVAILNETTCLTDSMVESAVASLQWQVKRDLAPIWGIDADLTFVPTGSKPAAKSWRLVLLDDSPTAGALGYHDVTEEGLPLAKVFVKSALYFNYQWSLAASHELLETLVNPRLNLVAFVQTAKKGRLFIYEVCDPCSHPNFGYDIDGVLVSDFVLPAWFESYNENGSTQFDYLNHIKNPLEILPGCYASVYDASSDVGWYKLTASSRELNAAP